MCAAKLCQLRGCVGPVCLCVPAAAGAGLEPGGNVSRAPVTPTLRRSSYTLSREERAGGRGERQRRVDTQHTSLLQLKQVINF